MSARRHSGPGDVSAPATTARRTLQVEIDAAKLLELLRDHQLCASDLRCLDPESKRCLWGLCLLACADRRA